MTPFEKVSKNSPFTKELLIWAMGGVALTCASAFGIVGNTMSVIVLTRKRVPGTGGGGGGGGMRRGGNEASFSSLLRGLATFDALFLVTAMLSFGLPKLSPGFRAYLFPYCMRVSYHAYSTFFYSSKYLLMILNMRTVKPVYCI